MAWRDDLARLRDDLDTAIQRTVGDSPEEPTEFVQQRAELYQLAARLEIAQMLIDLNEVVLRGAGTVESTSHLDYYDDDDDFDFELDDEDDEDDDLDDDDGDGEPLEDDEEVRFSLIWDEAKESAVDVELTYSGGRVHLLVNGEEVRQQREVLETAVLDAFRDEMDLA